MIYDLPTRLEVGGEQYEIRSDYRAILDIIMALSDPDLNDQEKAAVMLDIFYPNFENMPAEHLQEAIDQCKWFIDGGDEQDTGRKSPALMSWEQDFPYIVAPINRVVGKDIRSIPYDREENTGGLHWWTFLSAYYEIGDCLFAQIVGIRQKKAKGKRLDKSEQEWYRQNRHLVDLKTRYTNQEQELLKAWGVN